MQGRGRAAELHERLRPELPRELFLEQPSIFGSDAECDEPPRRSPECRLSYGGSMSYTAMCNMSDKFRAVAGMAGAPISGARCANTPPERPVAVLGIHGEEDTALPITMAEPIIEAMIERNGCTSTTSPSELLDSTCATAESALPTGAYQGCMQGYPVIWCPMPGRPHEIPTWSGASIARFFMQF
jgi:poly(3-hydroxybutyrate) depolymerase